MLTKAEAKNIEQRIRTSLLHRLPNNRKGCPSIGKSELSLVRFIARRIPLCTEYRVRKVIKELEEIGMLVRVKRERMIWLHKTPDEVLFGLP